MKETPQTESHPLASSQLPVVRSVIAADQGVSPSPDEWQDAKGEPVVVLKERLQRLEQDQPGMQSRLL
jgi:hypothetical protein